MYSNADFFSLNMLVPSDHPSLVGHFPGNPIVPGVVILDQMMQLWQKHSGKQISAINHAKFVQILRANISCTITYVEKGASKVTFLIEDEADNVISKGQFYYDG